MLSQKYFKVEINPYAAESTLVPFIQCSSFFYNYLQNKAISDGVDAAYTLEVVKDAEVREKPLVSDTQSSGARVDDGIKESSPESVEVEESEDESEEEEEGRWSRLAQLLPDSMCDCILCV